LFEGRDGTKKKEAGGFEDISGGKKDLQEGVHGVASVPEGGLTKMGKEKEGR